MEQQTYQLAIVNGNVVFPGDRVEKTNVYVNDGKIAAVTAEQLKADEVIDAAGKYVMPGVFDPHTHLGLFNPIEVEAETESRAALTGGVTTIGTFFGGPKPHSETFPHVSDSINAKSYVDIVPHLVIGSEDQLKEIGSYIRDFGVKSFKIYLNGVPGIVPWVSDEFILKVMDEIKAQSGGDCVLCCHCENPGIVANATEKYQAKYDGSVMDTVKWADTHPSICEKEAVNRISVLSQYNDFPVYIVHMFSGYGPVEAKRLRQENKKLFVETTSPYLSTTKDGELGNALKMEPPFQGKDDLESLWQGVKDGVIDAIGTDTVTMTRAEKNIDDKNYWHVLPGYPAVEHHLPILLSEGVNKRGIAIERLAECTSMAPAKIFGLYPRKGSFEVGADADINVIDLELEKTVKAADTVSRSDFSIYEGRTIKGWPVVTVKGGKVAVRDGKLVLDAPTGSCVKR